MPQRARQCRPAGHVGLRQVPRLRPRCRGMAGRAFANRIPKKVGPDRPLPSADAERRRALGIHRLSNGAREGFYLVSAGAFERHDHDYLRKALPAEAASSSYPVTTQCGVLVLAGPRSREVLQGLTDADLSNAAFPWLTGKEINVGVAHGPCAAGQFRRRARLGAASPDRDADHHVRPDHGCRQAELGIRPFGIKAMDRRWRIEKSYRLIPRELSIEYSAYESGLDRFVHPNKGDVHRPRRAGAVARTRLQRTASSRSRSTTSRMSTPAAPSRSTTGRGRWSAAAPRAAMAGASANRWRLPWSAPISARSAARSACAYSARPTRRPSSRSRLMIQRT